MKVVLFCGGLGMRLREYSEAIPKPMVPIGYRPMLWHVMRYYAHFGHKDFILCLGWKADVIKQYFLDYDECLSNDFVLREGGTTLDLLGRDIDDWNITFVDTGVASNIGERLLAVRDHLDGEEAFLANYTDGLTDLHLPDLLSSFERQRATASFVSVRPRHSFHAVQLADDGIVQRVGPIATSGVWMNGGFFVLRREIFDVLHAGEELVGPPFDRLIASRRLGTLRHEGFWSCLDTFKEKQALDDLYARGDAPWEVWKRPSAAAAGTERRLRAVEPTGTAARRTSKSAAARARRRVPSPDGPSALKVGGRRC